MSDKNTAPVAETHTVDKTIVKDKNPKFEFSKTSVIIGGAFAIFGLIFFGLGLVSGLGLAQDVVHSNSGNTSQYHEQGNNREQGERSGPRDESRDEDATEEDTENVAPTRPDTTDNETSR
jgi:hypothetical protein